MVKHSTHRSTALIIALITLVAVFAVFFTGTSARAGALDYIIGADKSVSANDRGLIRKAGSGTQNALIADFDDCLTDAEETELLSALESAAKKANVNVGVVITRDLEGKSDEGFVRGFSDEQFGANSASIMLMLLNTYNAPEYDYYTDCLDSNGTTANKKFDGKRDRMLERITDKLGNPKGYKYAYNENTHSYGGYDYAAGIKEYAKCVKRYGGNGFSKVLVMLSDFIVTHPIGFLVVIGVSLLITFGIVGGKVKGYKRKATLSASSYLDRSATRVTNSVDRFVREYTTSHTHSSSGVGHGGGGGGGGHHTSHGSHR